MLHHGSQPHAHLQDFVKLLFLIVADFLAKDDGHDPEGNKHFFYAVALCFGRTLKQVDMPLAAMKRT